MQSNAILRSVRKELLHYPGVEFEVREGGKHKRVVFHRNGSSRFLTIPRSPSDWRAGKNALRDFKKTMGELGAQRLDVLPGQTRGLRKRGNVGLSLNHQALIVHIPITSKLIDRFKTADGKSKAHWRFELRASPDLSAPPMLALIETVLPPGKERTPGLVAGYEITGGKGWRLSIARKQVPALSKRVDTIKSVDIELYEDTGKELVFKLPTGIIPTKFKPHPPVARVEAPAAPLPSQAWAEPHPPVDVEAAVLAALAKIPAAEPTPGLPQNLVLQFPKQPVSVEQAIAVLNKAKQRLGNNLRFTVAENGYLTATHRIGH